MPYRRACCTAFKNGPKVSPTHIPVSLGANHAQVFCKITLPFLRPALISAAALAFMQSFESYNTTLFAIGFQQTLPIYIGTKLRQFISPAMHALAVIFIALTVTGARDRSM